ncbi:hypothetical protein A5747_16685 [Mycobacterium sp. IS-836]|uniref:PE family protein n=1 Tax=Mycobacterium sp. IS-836 TaxID=1834160 RepID=UPI00096C4F9E|nr:PE family protein [Mycobacterium sp. IS-836]OMC54142.1 hypothetical protein A5747_16685 [Mycobacterium sp. IS-836]
MSYVKATPAYVAAAASDLASIGSTIGSANAAAAGPTSSVLPPGADEVSASIAALFDTHSQIYQQLSAQAALFHQQFVQLMGSSGAEYAATEAANAGPLQAAGQSVLGTAGSAGSMVAGVPAVATAGLTGAPAAAAPAANLAAAVSPASAGPAAPPAVAAPLAATPVRPGPLAPAGAPSGAVQPETHSPTPATLVHSTQPVAGAEAEPPEASPASAMPAPLAASAAASAAVSPAKRAFSPAAGAGASFTGQPAHQAPQ